MLIYVPLWLAVVLGVMALFLRVILKVRRQARRIRDTPWSQAEALPSGFVKMKGRIQAVNEDEILESPLTRTLCVYYKFTVTESVQRGRRTYLVTLVNDLKKVDAVLIDRTGEIAIDLFQAEVAALPTARRGGLLNAAPSPAIEERLQRRYGFSVKGMILRRALHYTETVIDDGMKVVVAGEIRTDEDGKPCLRKSRLTPLLIARSEDELNSHFRGNFFGWIAAGVIFTLALLIGGGFLGILINQWEASHQVNPPQVNRPDPAPPAEVKKSNPVLDRKLTDLRSRDRPTRLRAVKDLVAMPVDEDHRHEVAQALNALLDVTDPGQCDAGLEAVEQWGTRQDNAWKLSNLSSARNPEIAAKADRILKGLK